MTTKPDIPELTDAERLDWLQDTLYNLSDIRLGTLDCVRGSFDRAVVVVETAEKVGEGKAPNLRKAIDFAAAHSKELLLKYAKD
jgi:hypothetical protein